MKIRGEFINFDDLLIVPQRSTIESRKDVNTTREFLFYHSPRKWEGVPLICSNMAAIATKAMALTLQKYKIITCLHKYFTLKDLISIFQKDGADPSYVWISIGKNEKDINKLFHLKQELGYEPNICIDVPNGHMQSFVDYCNEVRKTFRDSIILAGNVSTRESAIELIIHGGVDICKIFIGTGRNCKTTKVTGVGCGTASCIDECSSVHGLKSNEKRLGLICADGGMKEIGDICKSFCLNADFIMIGNMFAGYDPCDNWTCNKDGQKLYMTHYGMSSHYAQEKHGEGRKNYRASEGIVNEVGHKGAIEPFIEEILGGIRSCAAYIGARSLKEMSKCTEFLIRR